jgi:DNA-binding NtrC family response regulator
MSAARLPEDSQPPCVLVVDDHEEIRELLREILEDDGYTVVEAGDGRGALAALRVSRIDLVLTDLVMPELEGLGTIREILRLAPGIPVVAMSGAAGGTYLQAARLMGACETLRKPFSATAILRIAGRWLSGRVQESVRPADS